MFESVSKGGCKWPIRPSCTVTLIKYYLCIDVKDEAAFLNFKYAAGFDAYVAYSRRQLLVSVISKVTAAGPV